MLLKSQSNLPLPQKPQKILHIYPTYNETYLMLSIQSHLTQQITHLDKFGKILKQRTYENSSLSGMGMVNDRCAVILDRINNLIIQWNIETDQYLQVGFMYCSEQISEIYELHIFNQTHTFCVLELGSQKSNIFKLSYFKYPLQGQDQPILTYENQQIWTHNHLVKKVNNHSMISWLEMYLDTKPVIKMYYLSSISNIYQGTYKEYHISSATNWNLYSNIEISVSNFWEIRPLQFLFITITDQLYDDAQGKYPNTNFVYSVLDNTFRRSLFVLPADQKNQYIDCQLMGPISTIRTYKFSKSKSKPSPIYYIENLTEQILAIDQWQCSHLYKYQSIASMPGLLIQCKYENIDVENVEINVKQILSKKLISCFIMEEIVRDCDGDLVEFVGQIFGAS